MKNKLKSFGKGAWLVLSKLFIALLTYIFLMIDRAILVPFPFVHSKSIDGFSSSPDRFASNAFIRVCIAIGITALLFTIKLFM